MPCTLDGADDMEGDIDCLSVGYCDGMALIDGTNEGEANGYLDVWGLVDGESDGELVGVVVGGLVQLSPN